MYLIDLMLHQMRWSSTLWIYLTVCRLHVNNGWVQCDKLSYIDLYWYYLCHKLRNAECMIHLDLRYAYNHFDCLILVYKMFLSLRQAFQGLTPNAFFLNLKCWNLENINVLKTLERFWGRTETEYLRVIVNSGTLRLAPDEFTTVHNWILTKTQKHTKSFVQFVLMVIVFTITLMEHRH